MNKALFDQLSAEEHAAAEKLSSAAEMMKLSQSFQWNLESQLMDAYPSRNEKHHSLLNPLKPVGWALTVLVGVLLVSRLLRTLLPDVQPAMVPTETREVSFEENVRQGNICAAPLAVSHNFTVSLTNPDKTQLTAVDSENAIGEIRSFTWSADGKELLLLGNTLGSGNIYRADPASGRVRAILPPGELGYMMDAAWSSNTKRVALWSMQNNKILYTVNLDGAELAEQNLGDTQILSAPQFWPDGLSVVFYGANPNGTEWFEFIFNDSQLSGFSAINSVESAVRFAFSPDGTKVAFMEYDHENGEAHLFVRDLTTYELEMHGTFSIPKGSGSSIPATVNMSWSANGTSIVFDVGRGAYDRIIYLAHADGTELIKVVEGYAPAISSDGQCLAYIQNKEVFLLDMNQMETATPLSIGKLPAGKGGPNYQLDRLQWKP